MERSFLTVDQALDSEAGRDLPWGRIDSMIVRADAKDDRALVVLDVSVNTVEDQPTRATSLSAQVLGRWAALVTAGASTVGFGAQHWAMAVVAAAAVGIFATRLSSIYGFPDENKPRVARENVRAVGVAVDLNTRTFEPGAFYGDVQRFEDVVAEINVAAQFNECRDEARGRAWEAACLDNAPTRCPSDDPDDWWAYWLAFRAVTRQNRRNTV